jgi:hypothetical protein
MPSGESEDRARVNCPKCTEPRQRSEFVRIFRYVRSGSGEGAPVEVLRHRQCNGIVYVLIK